MTDRKTDPLPYLVDDAFRLIVEVGELIYASGATRVEKDECIKAHSALLQLRLMHPVRP